MEIPISRHPYQSYAERRDHGGPIDWNEQVAIHRVNALHRLREMTEAEPSIVEQEANLQQITDRLHRIQAEHEMNMRYLILYGVRADEREEFRRILDEVAEHGGLSLKQAANLARARFRHRRDAEQESGIVVQ